VAALKAFSLGAAELYTKGTAGSKVVISTESGANPMEVVAGPYFMFSFVGRLV